jgi:hypothetical protein
MEFMVLDLGDLEVAPGVVVNRATLTRLEAKPRRFSPKVFDKKVQRLLAA